MQQHILPRLQGLSRDTVSYIHLTTEQTMQTLYIPVKRFVKEIGHDLQEARHKVVAPCVPRRSDGASVLLLQLCMFLL